MQMIAFQPDLCPALPTVIGNVDYHEFKATLERIDELLRDGGVEGEFIRRRVQHVEQELSENPKHNGNEPRHLSSRGGARTAAQAARALRCNIARALVGGSCREFSWRLADSSLLQWFCGLSSLDVVRVPSKSTLDRYSRLVPESLVREVIAHLTRVATTPSAPGDSTLGLCAPLSLDSLFLDTTCVPANIHFPVDWVLLRDAARTLLKAVAVIRRRGLRHRMGEPAEFMRRVNRLCIEMTHSRRRVDGRKQRKRILRSLKKLLQTIDGHAERYSALLADRWQETDLQVGEVRQILARLDNIRQQLPMAIKQAHERIIGGRQMKNSDKILSFYEPDVRVIVRGKAGAEVEFGNTLLLAEQDDGVIVDWRLVRDQAPADSRLLQESLMRFSRAFEDHKLTAAIGDRGFDSAANRGLLQRSGIYNGICPKSVPTLHDRMQEKRFVALQHRRGQTEGRVGILKNCYLGRPCRRKGFVHRELNVSWSVLTHNLWVIARLPMVEAEHDRIHEAA